MNEIQMSYIQKIYYVICIIILKNQTSALLYTLRNKIYPAQQVLVNDVKNA